MLFFFFQAEDGIRDLYVTGVQTCALPIYRAFRLVVSDNWLAGFLRTPILARIAALALGQDRLQRAAFRVVPQIGSHYRNSDLSDSAVDSARGAPRRGGRFSGLGDKCWDH